MALPISNNKKEDGGMHDAGDNPIYMRRRRHMRDDGGGDTRVAFLESRTFLLIHVFPFKRRDRIKQLLITKVLKDKKITHLFSVLRLLYNYEKLFLLILSPK